MPGFQIRVIARAVTILDCFIEAGGSLGITELARRSQLSKSTVHHVVSTLVETGLLAPDGATRRYRLGPKVAQLGNAFIESTDLRDQVAPLMTQLRDLTNETVTLHMKVGDERVIMAQVPSTQGIRRMLEVGSSRPLHLGAAGIVLMIDLPDQEILRLLKRSRPRRLTAHTVIDPREILALVQRTRVDGYCMLSEQTEVGVGAIGLPIYDHRGAVPASLLISGPYNRWNPEAMKPHLKAITTLVTDVSRRLGRRLDESAQVATHSHQAQEGMVQVAR